MNKKNIILILLIIVVIVIAFIFGKKGDLTDAEKFKKEYESLNNTVNESNNKKYREVNISKDNPIVYATAEDIVEKINNKETFAVYFGFAKCPWCRSALETLLEVADDLSIDTIYYVDVENIRNTMSIEDGEVKETKKGTEGYYALLEKLDNVLDDYSLTSEDGESTSANQKRIYAPNIVAILGGKAENLTDGISASQDDAYMKLTTKMKKEMYNKIKCTLECLNVEETTCQKNAC